MTRADVVVALGGGVVGDLAGFCAATYQRGVRVRAGADDARRPGRLGLRRQDRRRPGGGQELRRRLPPAAGGDRRHRHAARRCRPRSSRPATPRWSRRRCSPAAGCGSGSARGAEPDRPRGDRRVRSAPSCGSSPQDERDGGLRQIAQPRPHGRPRDRDRRPATPRYRHGEAVGARAAGGAAAVGRRRSARRGRRAAARPGLPTGSRHDVDPDAVVVATARDKKRVGEGPVPFVLLPQPGRAPGRAARSRPRELIAAVQRAGPLASVDADVRNRIEVMHGVNLDQLGRRDPAHYGALTLTELELQISETAARAGARDAVLSDQPRGRVRRAPARARRPRRRRSAQPGRLDPLLVRDPRRARAGRAAGGRGPPVRHRRARGVAAPVR